MSHALYLVGAIALGLRFVCHAFALMLRLDTHPPLDVFAYSVRCLTGLFTLLLVDHYAL